MAPHRFPLAAPLAAAIVLALSPAAAAAPRTAAHASALAQASERTPTELDHVEVVGEMPGYTVQRSTTATRTDTPLVDVPQAVSVVSQQQIRDLAIQSMADAVRYVPGIGITQGEGNRDGLVFRGNSSTADLFVDGMRDDVQYYRDTYNIDRIEAFKGPNAMIFGRGSPGGLLNRVTKVADGVTTREVGVQVGSWDKRRVTADVGQSLSADAAFRVTGVYEDSGSYRDGVTVRREGVNPTLMFSAGDATRVTVGYEYFHDERTADRGIPSQPAAFEGTRYPVETSRSTFFGDPDGSPTWVDVHALTALVEHRFAGGAQLRNRTRYADYDKLYRNVFPGAVNAATGTVQLAAYDNATRRENLLNQTDLVFEANTGAVSHTFLAGAEFGRQETDNLRQSGSFLLGAGSPCLNTSATGRSGSCTVPLASPNVAAQIVYANNSANGSGDARNTGVARVAALYLQDQIEFSPQWQAIVGVRFDRFDLDYTDLRAGVSAANRDLSSSDDLLSPRVGLVYKPTADSSVYASYGVTYLPRSGEQLSSLSATTQALDPEEFENLEIGAKWDMSERLSASVALYRLNRSNAAVTDPTDPTRMILLAGDSQRVDGAELSLSGQLTDAWSLIASYAYQDARTVQTVGGTPAGRVLPQTPEHSAGLWSRYDVSPRWGVGLGAVYRDRSFASISNEVTLKSYTRYDAAVFYRISDRLEAQLNLENVFDKTYYPSAHSDSNITPGAPRAAYLSVAMKF